MYETLLEFKTIIPKLLTDTNTIPQIAKQSGISVGTILYIGRMDKKKLRDFKITAKEKALMQDFCKANVEKAYSMIVDDQDDMSEPPVFDSEIESYGMKKAKEKDLKREPKPVVFRGRHYVKNPTEMDLLFIAIAKLERSNTKPSHIAIKN